MQKQPQLKIFKTEELPADWFKRQKADPTSALELENSVKAIIAQVKADGDAALVELALKFDKTELTARNLQVRKEEFKSW